MPLTTTDLPGLAGPGLLPLLAERLDGFDATAPLDARLLAGGRSNITYRLTQGDRSWVLRRPPLGNVMPSAHDMVREHTVLSGLDRAGYPVPRPLLLCEDVAVLGVPFLVMEHVDGRVVADADDAARLSAAEADAVSEALASTLARLHQVDVEACGLRGLGRPEGYLVRQVRRWADQWRRTRTRELDDVDRLLAWLGEHVERLPEDLPWSAVHGDYRLDNTILAADRPEVVAVLDWEMATLGDPVGDLAVALVYWSEASDGLRREIPVAEHVTEGPGFWTRSQVAERYASLTGSDLAHLDVCVALACLKLAVIMESIHRRTLEGQQLGTAATDDGAMGRAATALAAMGVRVASGRGVEALSS